MQNKHLNPFFNNVLTDTNENINGFCGVHQVTQNSPEMSQFLILSMF